MTIVLINIDSEKPSSLKKGNIDLVRVDTTSEQDIAAQIIADEQELILDAAKFALKK
ncbi:hypothetical protein [Polynucleobacter antarcticus]|uniref:hypothetical protein n=1 Tax=Polynucleobacter antarcticus TaxID=1743162 RepID=UPI00156F8FA3|nr:hypothetical protein [Polynucleobacter antarcticus]